MSPACCLLVTHLVPRKSHLRNLSSARTSEIPVPPSGTRTGRFPRAVLETRVETEPHPREGFSPTPVRGSLRPRSGFAPCEPEARLSLSPEYKRIVPPLDALRYPAAPRILKRIPGLHGRCGTAARLRRAASAVSQASIRHKARLYTRLRSSRSCSRTGQEIAGSARTRRFCGEPVFLALWC